MFFDRSKNLNNLTRGHLKTIFARLIDYLQIRPEGFDEEIFLYIHVHVKEKLTTSTGIHVFAESK